MVAMFSCVRISKYSAVRRELYCGEKCGAVYFSWVQCGEKCGALQWEVRCSVFQLDTVRLKVLCITVRSAVYFISVGYIYTVRWEVRCSVFHLGTAGRAVCHTVADRPLRAGIGQSEPAAGRTGAREGLRDRNRQEQTGITMLLDNPRVSTCNCDCRPEDPHTWPHLSKIRHEDFRLCSTKLANSFSFFVIFF